MKRVTFFLFVLALFSSDNSFAQEIRMKGFWVKNGFIQKEDKSVILAYNEIFYRTPQKQGRVKTIHADSKVLTRYMEFADKAFKVPHGKYQEWKDNGDLRINGLYRDGLKEGQWSFYALDSCIVKKTILYKAGLKNGPQIEYYSNGKPKTIADYSKDMLNGTSYLLSESGDTLSTALFKDGSLLETKFLIDKDSISALPKFYPARLENSKCRLDISSGNQTRFISNEVHQEFQKIFKVPSRDRNIGVTGSAVFRLIIDELGELKNVLPVNGLSNSFTEKVKKTIPKMKGWLPAKNGNTPTNSEFILYVSFEN